MASEPYERPQLPSPVRALNERQRLIGAPDEVRSLGHLTVSEYGAAAFGPSPASGRSVSHIPIELSWDSPSVVLDAESANGWAVGLTEDQVTTVMAAGGTYDQRAFLAEGYRQMNSAQRSEPNGSVRKPRYVNPSDALPSDGSGLPVETLRERDVTPEEKKRRRFVRVPPDAVTDALGGRGSVPVAFTEVESNALHKVRPQTQYKKSRNGRMTLHRGRPIDR